MNVQGCGFVTGHLNDQLLKVSRCAVGAVTSEQHTSGAKMLQDLNLHRLARGYHLWLFFKTKKIMEGMKGHLPFLTRWDQNILSHTCAHAHTISWKCWYSAKVKDVHWAVNIYSKKISHKKDTFIGNCSVQTLEAWDGDIEKRYWMSRREIRV